MEWAQPRIHSKRVERSGVEAPRGECALWSAASVEGRTEEGAEGSSCPQVCMCRHSCLCLQPALSLCESRLSLYPGRTRLFSKEKSSCLGKLRLLVRILVT